MLVHAVVSAVWLTLVSSQTVVNVSVPEQGRVTFMSPNYPGPYTHNLNLRYNVRGPVGHALEFDVEAYDTEWNLDFLTLTESVPGHVDGNISFGYGDTGGVTAITSVFRSVTNEVTGIFRTDSSEAKRGFKIGVRSVSATQFSAVATSPLMGNCTRGKLAWSEENFLETDKTSLQFAFDHTYQCRKMMYEIHGHILTQLIGTPRKEREFVDRPLVVTCDAAGYWISESQQNEAEASVLIFETTANLRCRTIFVEFLDYISAITL